MPHAALRVQYGQRGPSAVVAVVVLKRGKNRGQLNLCVGLLLLFNIPGSLVVRIALFFWGRQLGGRQRALLSARHIAAVRGGGTGHASFVVGNRVEQERFSVLFKGKLQLCNVVAVELLLGEQVCSRHLVK